MKSAFFQVASGPESLTPCRVARIARVASRTLCLMMAQRWTRSAARRSCQVEAKNVSSDGWVRWMINGRDHHDFPSRSTGYFPTFPKKTCKLSFQTRARIRWKRCKKQFTQRSSRFLFAFDHLVSPQIPLSFSFSTGLLLGIQWVAIIPNNLGRYHRIPHNLSASINHQWYPHVYLWHLYKVYISGGSILIKSPLQYPELCCHFLESTDLFTTMCVFSPWQ